MSCWQRWWAYGVLGVGSLQLLGFLGSVDLLRRVGQLSAAAPLPLVFSQFRGLETFSSKFTLVATAADGTVREIPITPELYSRFPGPYNRRNVYGAAIAYGLALDRPEEKQMITAVLQYAFCAGGPLRNYLQNLGLVSEGDAVAISVTPKGGVPTRLEIWCQR